LRKDKLLETLLENNSPVDKSQNKRESQSPWPIVILISGRGSNMRALVEQTDLNKQPSGSNLGKASTLKVARVISDNPSAPGLIWAKEHGVDTVVLPDRATLNSKKEYYDHLLARILEVQPKLVCLAGFMNVLPAFFIEALFPKIINIHPSLLPAFPGLNTHERALAAGVTKHGCSIHIVIPEVDAGPLIAQALVQVDPEDTPQTLSARVLEKEHQMYSWVVSMIYLEDIQLGKTVSFSQNARDGAVLQGYILPSGTRSPGWLISSSNV